MRILTSLAAAGFIALASPALALDKVTFGTNWLADPEAGGYYQAVVDGTYPLERAVEALARLQNRQVFGKLVIVP